MKKSFILIIIIYLLTLTSCFQLGCEHDFKSSVIMATCTEDGYILKTCIKCNEKIKENIQKAAGHSFSEWLIEVEATDTHDGLKKRICKYCNLEEKSIVQSITYINLDFLKEPFDSNTTYICNTYEELLFKFNCALLNRSTSLFCEVSFDYSNLNSLLNKMIEDKSVSVPFTINVKSQGKLLTCTLTYPNDPNLKTLETRYVQYNSHNYQENYEKRSIYFDDFIINKSIYEFNVKTTDQLFYALERGVKPICEKGSAAEKIYEEMKKVLRDIINDNMDDYQKIKAIHDYLILNVTYDKDLLDLLYQNDSRIKEYNGFYLEGVFIDKKAVCEGISKSFASLCNIEGIPCVMVEGIQKNNPNGAGHAWNKVYVDHKWYIVDVTSDGTVLDNQFEVLSYQYFLIEEKEYQERYIGNYYDEIVCNNSYNIYKYMHFEYDGVMYNFHITSQEELNVLVKYFESFLENSKKEQITIEFYVDFNYGDSCEDEVQKAYQSLGINVNYLFLNNGSIFMLIK